MLTLWPQRLNPWSWILTYRLTRCRAEGRYRYLCPEARPSWEAPPRLPSMRELVDWPAAERLAMLWLVVHYLGEEE